MAKKRGQIAVFVILGISVIILVGLFGYTQSNLTHNKVSYEIKKASKTPLEISSIKRFAESCLKEVSDRGLWIVGEHGGYIDPEGNITYGEPGTIDYIQYDHVPVPYYIGGTPLTLEEIQEKLARYIIIEFERCFNFTTFENDGFLIESPALDYHAVNFDFDLVDVDSDVTINEDTVTVKLRYPLNITKNTFKTRLKDFRVDLPLRLGKIYNAMHEPDGLLPKIQDTWAIPDIFYLASFDCDEHDPLHQINIYSKDHSPTTKVLQIVDYRPYYSKYMKSYLFQFAITKDPIDFEDDICTGTVFVP